MLITIIDYDIFILIYTVQTYFDSDEATTM